MPRESRLVPGLELGGRNLGTQGDHKTMTKLTKEELEALATLDSPTVCNALEVVAPERRG